MSKSKQHAQQTWFSRKGRIASAAVQIRGIYESLGLKLPPCFEGHISFLNDENDKIARLQGINVKGKYHGGLADNTDKPTGKPQAWSDPDLDSSCGP